MCLPSWRKAILADAPQAGEIAAPAGIAFLEMPLEDTDGFAVGIEYPSPELPDGVGAQPSNAPDALDEAHEIAFSVDIFADKDMCPGRIDAPVTS